MNSTQNMSDWRGKPLLDRDGEKLGKLEDVYVDTDSDEQLFGTIKEGMIGRHLTFVPLRGSTASPDHLQVTVSKRTSRTPRTSIPTASCPRKTRPACLPTTDSTTPRCRQKVGAAWLGADVHGPAERTPNTVPSHARRYLLVLTPSRSGPSLCPRAPA